MRTYYDAINAMCPGDSLDVTFPTDFVLEYNMRGETVSFVCVRMIAWYWDDDDHRCLDKYFHEEGKHTWTCKDYYLTKESMQKVDEYLKTVEYPYEH
jgi:hypothetical protein